MMTPQELDRFLAEQRTCRVATVDAAGHPHVSPLWFAWDGASLWLYSITRSRRWTQLVRDPRLAVVVDDGHGYGELRGAELSGTAVFVGEAPRTGEPLPEPENSELAAVEKLFAAKYFGMDTMPHDTRHAWLRLTPTTITTWDFAKLPQG
ncbi:pyridoxamine 5'-phosphate oxidase family protein [Streptomyces pathocidini]|uniref:Pyridoxamine 5'-phosphate oxidase family protein n=1 Tax=Streptomyces pathocidini TaxID=1650571 RepID=A0ABW7V370_9ACTN